MRRALIGVGCLLLLAGLALGFLPQSAHGVDCGSVFRGSDDAAVSDLVDSFSNQTGTASDDCDDRRALYRPVVWVLLIVGAGAAVGSTFVREPQPRT